MTVHCPRCGSGNLRPAHFRRSDLPYLLILRFPVRCRYCRDRFHVGIFRIRKVRLVAEERHAHEDERAHRQSQFYK